MGTLWQDIRYGLRLLRKSPGFTAIALVTLAIGIGANAIMFSIADVLLLRPLSVKEPERLVGCAISDFRVVYSAYLTLREQNRAFSDLMAQYEDMPRVILATGDSTQQVDATFVSANYFSFLGAVPIQGRGFLPDENRYESPPVVVLSYRTWRRQGADPNLVGKTVRINGVSCQVVGVAPKDFTGTALRGPDVWLPLGSYVDTMVLARGETVEAERWGDLATHPWPLVTVGRLRPGMNMSAAQASLQAMIPILKAQFPRHWNSRCAPYLYAVPRLYIGSGARERPFMTGISLFLVSTSAVILIIACVNLTNMLIIRGTRRCREIALRLALGGGRGQIVRQLLVESLLLGLLGGAVGLALAWGGTRILNNWFAASRDDIFQCLRAGLSVRVLAMTAGVSLAATLLFGLRPALVLSRRDIISELKESGSALLRPTRRVRGGLSVLCQVALAVALVMVAALFCHRALWLAWPRDTLDMDATLVTELDPLSAGYDRTHSAQVCQALADRLTTLPGVDAVGASPSFAFGGSGVDAVYTYTPGAEGDGSERFLANYAARSEVDRDYFASVGLPLLQGRCFNHFDTVADAENVVIVDETLARKLELNGDVLGAWIRFGWLNDRSEPFRVVGVVPNVPRMQRDRVFSQTYTPTAPEQICTCLYLRIDDPDSTEIMRERIGAAVHEVDSHVPVLSVRTLADRHRDHEMLWFAGFTARLIGTVGATALFLAGLGIFAVKGYMVASRTREIGIRKALGATRRDIMTIVLREGIVLTAVGLIAGIWLGLGATRLVASVMPGYRAIDPVSIIATTVLLGLAALLASYIPARRATKIDPMEALRYE